jgi:hypothetical protein
MFAKNTAKFVLRKPRLAYSGHFAVSRSLIHGLQQVDARFNYNPRRPKDVGDHVHVLAGVKALQMAIELKKKNKIKHLTAGPNVFEDAFESDRMITSKEIEVYITHTDWVIDFFISQVDECRDKLRIWAAGVDADYWTPAENHPGEKKNVLFYIKNVSDEDLVKQVIRECERAECNVSMIRYGNYSKEGYLDHLRKADCMIMVGTTESQSLAQFEAWSVNVPTLVFARDHREYKGKIYKASSSPFLNPQLGFFFRDAAELAAILADKTIFALNPREYILRNHTDKLSAIDFLKKINYRDEY